MCPLHLKNTSDDDDDDCVCVLNTQVCVGGGCGPLTRFFVLALPLALSQSAGSFCEWSLVLSSVSRRPCTGESWVMRGQDDMIARIGGIPGHSLSGGLCASQIRNYRVGREANTVEEFPVEAADHTCRAE